MGLKSLLSSSGDVVILVGTDDVFNYDHPNQKKLEHELLDSTKVSFKLKFSVKSHSYTIKNGQSRQTSQATHKFRTGKSKQDFEDLHQLLLPHNSLKFMQNQQ